MSLKLLTSPMMKDFLRIFQFLYSMLDPGHKVRVRLCARTLR